MQRRHKRKMGSRKRKSKQALVLTYSSSVHINQIHISTTEYVNRKFKDGMKRYYKFYQDNLIRSLNLYRLICGTKTIIMESIT